jgi:CxxC motif-containing protein
MNKYITLMEAKNKLIGIIREWVKTDNEMRTLKSELSTRKKGKDALSAQLMNIMKEEEIDSVDINDGRIEYASRKTKKPITKKLLLNILSTYYNGDTSMASEVNNFILNNREEVVKDVIVRKVDK